MKTFYITIPVTRTVQRGVQMTETETHLKKILIIYGHPMKYGFGHYRRMATLSHFLAGAGHSVHLIPDDDKPAELKYDAVILDMRDEDFPEYVRGLDAVFIAMDNRGDGRSRSDKAIDALPHFNMNDEEYVEALRLMILPEEVAFRRSRAREADIEYISGGDEKVPAADISLVKYPRQMVPPTVFFRRMLSADTVAAYFGRTAFEAIYLGKRLYLYSFSPYHDRLSKDFIFRWNRLKPYLALDGLGVRRVVDIILNSIPA